MTNLECKHSSFQYQTKLTRFIFLFSPCVYWSCFFHIQVFIQLTSLYPYIFLTFYIVIFIQLTFI